MNAKWKIFDAHHHLWDLTHCNYPWLMAKGVQRFFGDPTPIQKNYLVHDLRTDAQAYELVGSTHIQVGVVDEDAVKETLWLDQLSKADGLPNAIVAYADLSRPDLSNHLEQHAAAAGFRGIRQIIGRHPSEDKKTQSGDLLRDPAFLSGLKQLVARGLSFDLQLTEWQYEDAIRVFEQVPELPVAICHFASPWDLSKDGFRRWKSAIDQLSQMPNIHMKFSGFGMFKPDWSAADIEPYVIKSLEAFGASRCMAGSNFPVDKLYGSYDRIWRALEELIDDQIEREQVTLTNAQKFYGVTLA